MAEYRYIDAADVAKIIRKRLKAAFPKQKFSVRTRRASLMAAIDVTWENGPSHTDVDDLVGWMVGSDFDPMIDLKSSVEKEFEGETVRFGNDYLTLERSYTEAVVEAAVAHVRAKYAGFDEIKYNVADHGVWFKVVNVDWSAAERFRLTVNRDTLKCASFYDGNDPFADEDETPVKAPETIVEAPAPAFEGKLTRKHMFRTKRADKRRPTKSDFYVEYGVNLRRDGDYLLMETVAGDFVIATVTGDGQFHAFVEEAIVKLIVNDAEDNATFAVDGDGLLVTEAVGRSVYKTRMNHTLPRLDGGAYKRWTSTDQKGAHATELLDGMLDDATQKKRVSGRDSAPLVPNAMTLTKGEVPVYSGGPATGWWNRPKATPEQAVASEPVSDPDNKITAFPTAPEPEPAPDPEPTRCEICASDGDDTETYPGHTLCDTCAENVREYAGKLEARADRYRDLAQKADAESAATHEHARKMASVIPFGQPILVGHHSEKADRAYRNRIERAFRRSAAQYDKSKHYAHRAKAAERNAAKVIRTEDPAAVIKLREKLKVREASQTRMKAFNVLLRKAVRRHDSKADQAAYIRGNWDERNGAVFEPKQIAKLLEPDFMGRTGFPAYALRNNGAEIRRMKNRLVELETRQEKINDGAAAEREALGNGIELEKDVVENRLRMYFPAKPPESIREELKKNGFRWAKSRQAWQRHLSDHAEHLARQIANGV
ncbi:MAG: DUF3560 domain-containing protein [Chloroflexota bacterium]